MCSLAKNSCYSQTLSMKEREEVEKNRSEVVLDSGSCIVKIVTLFAKSTNVSWEGAFIIRNYLREIK